MDKVRKEYNENVKKFANRKAKKLGFKDENDFVETIDDYLIRYKNTNDETIDPRLLNMIEFFNKNRKKISNSTIADIFLEKEIIILLTKISEFHKKNSGCFRYYKDDDDVNNNKLVREKISGNFCISDDIDGDVPESEHPLYNIKDKWDCNYNNFDFNQMGSQTKVMRESSRLACKGLCDPDLYTVLSIHTTEYNKKIILPPEEYIYVCERGSILRYLSSKEKSSSSPPVIPILISIIIIIIILIFFAVRNHLNKRRKESILDYIIMQK